MSAQMKIEMTVTPLLQAELTNAILTFFFTESYLVHLEVSLSKLNMASARRISAVLEDLSCSRPQEPYFLAERTAIIVAY